MASKTGNQLILALFVFTAVHMHSVMAFGQNQGVTVTGVCLRTTEPDRGSVTVSASVLEKESSVAMRKGTKIYEDVRKAVIDLKLKNAELQTSGISLNPETEWQNGRSTTRGYRARLSLTISTSELARIGEVVKVSSEKGAKEVSSMEQTLSPEKMKKEYEACLDEAVKNARSKADAIAKAAGSRVGRLLEASETISSGGERPPSPRLMKAAFAESAVADSGPVIESAPTRLGVSIRARFGLD
ncbi:MAG: SIMPL domain-containing protein [Bdellovibrionales bacterium]|jgi:uncharacterized protein YggE|nr:SIMPL domain-containing protein [Bdellovibrionales bacterium]